MNIGRGRHEYSNTAILDIVLALAQIVLLFAAVFSVMFWLID